MVFAAMSTVLGVCENILAMVRELTGWSRPKGCVVCAAGIFVLALTTALGYSVIKFQPFAEGTAWLDLWDFIVSNNILPLGSLVLALFCCNKFGWGWDKFMEEANTGKGLKIKSWMKPIFKYFVPAAICVDSANNFDTTEEPVSPHSDVMQEVPTDAVHPGRAAYEQIADCLYSVICGTKAEWE